MMRADGWAIEYPREQSNTGLVGRNVDTAAAPEHTVAGCVQMPSGSQSESQSEMSKLAV